MAFGDHSRVQNTINQQGGNAQNWLDNIRNIFIPQNQNIWNRSQVANDRADRDYAGIQQGYQDQFNRIGSYLNGPGINYHPSNQNFGAYNEYSDFAKTGGYSPTDIQNLRARSNAPIRATYANAQNDLDRRNVIAGGNLANYGAAKAKMTRDLGINLGDQSLNTEAQLADMIHQGKLAGMAGMTGIDTSKMGEGLANASQNLQAQGMDASRILGLLNSQNNTLAGQRDLYGTTPGLANMYGNQLNNSNQNLVQSQQLQQQLAQMIIQGMLGMSSVPGNFQSAMGNIGSVLGLGSQVMGMIPGLGNLFSRGGGNYNSGGWASGSPSDTWS